MHKFYMFLGYDGATAERDLNTVTILGDKRYIFKDIMYRAYVFTAPNSKVAREAGEKAYAAFKLLVAEHKEEKCPVCDEYYSDKGIAFCTYSHGKLPEIDENTGTIIGYSPVIRALREVVSPLGGEVWL